jgi:uroporphyrinogen-III synthase
MASSTDPVNADNARPLILITRPVEDATGLVDALRAEGFDALVEPMLRIESLPDVTVDLADCRAILFTSANGVRAFAQASPVRHLPVVTVGTASAQAATEAGFEDIEASGGDVNALMETVQTRFPIEGGAFFHAAGSVTAGDLKGGLEARGYRVKRVPLYQSIKVERFSDACRAALDTGRISAVTFFSPRTAESFATVLMGEGRAPCARTVWALCLSDAVARAASRIRWLGIRRAETPDTQALIAEIKAVFGPENQMGRITTMADDKKNDSGAGDKEDPDKVDSEAGSNQATESKAEEGKAAENKAGGNNTGSSSDSDAAPDIAEAVSEFNTDAVIDAFGGIRPMASKLDVAVSTVQGWKNRGHIPENRWRDIITAASVHEVDLSVAMSSDAELNDAVPDTEETPASPWSDNSFTGAENTETPDDPVIDDEDRPEPVPQDDTTNASGTDSGAGGGGKLALLVAVAALAAVVARPVWAPYVDPYLSQYVKLAPSTGSNEGATSLKEEIAAISDRVSRVEARPVATGDGAVIPGDLATRLNALENDIEALSDMAESLQAIREETENALTETRAALAASVERDETSRARLLERMGVIESMLDQVSTEAERATAGLAGLEAQISRNGDDIADLKARPALEGAAQAGLALAVGDVESALSGGRPFNNALTRLSGLSKDNAAVGDAIAQLQSYAVSGVPTRAALIAEFQRNAPIMQSELNRDDGDVLDVLMEGARSLISIRKKGEAPDAPPVSRAEAALDRGDLASAVAALAPGRESSETVASWLSAAEARLAAEAALADLRDAVAAGLTAAPSQATPPEVEATTAGDPS